jgi:hypothetical protein
LAQSNVKTKEPFKPYCELELSIAGTIEGSISRMKHSMSEAGYGDLDLDLSGPGSPSVIIYPLVDRKAGCMLTFRYQFDPAQGLALKYGVVENYELTGRLEESTFKISNKLTTASILYTISTPNQRLKTSGGPSYSWMNSRTVTHYHSGKEAAITSGALGLNLNMAYSFIRSRHFHLAYYFDWNITGKVKVGPYNVGSYNWSAPDLSISTIKHGLTMGVAF